LIEINKALKKAQKQQTIKPFSPTIDPVSIKNKVEAVTKEAEANEASKVKVDVKVINAKESEEESQSQTVSDTEELNATTF